jgi:hypothetical protein
MIPGIIASGAGIVITNPVTYAAWFHAHWAEDPAWTNPGNGVGVSSWHDSGTGVADLANFTGTQQPIFRSTVAALNNKAGVQFDGSNDVLGNIFAGGANQTLTQVVIGSFTGTGAIQTIAPQGTGATAKGIHITAANLWALENGTQVTSATSVTTGAHLLIATNAGASSTLEVDGVQVLSGNAGAGNQGGDWRLGARGSTPVEVTNGHFAFYGLITGTLTSTQKSDLLAYARSYYGTP